MTSSSLVYPFNSWKMPTARWTRSRGNEYTRTAGHFRFIPCACREDRRYSLPRTYRSLSSLFHFSYFFLFFYSELHVYSNISLEIDKTDRDQVYGAESFYRRCQLFSYSTFSQDFMEPKGWLPHSKETSTGPSPEPDQSSSYHSMLFLAVKF
jgi:hypothetical protein